MPSAVGPVVVIVRKSTTRDGYGHATTTETLTVVQSYGLAPRTPDEDQEVGRNPNVQLATCYLPLGTQVDATDEIRDDESRTWQVDGQPMVWKSPYTGRGGVEVRLMRAVG